MLNPLSVLAKHYVRSGVRRVFRGYRMPVMVWKDAEGAHVLLRSFRGEPHPYGCPTNDGHTFSVFASDTNLVMGHLPPGEQWRNEAQIAKIALFFDEDPRSWADRSHGWDRWPGTSATCSRIGPLFFRTDTVANQRRQYAEYCVATSIEQAKTPA